MPTHTTERRNGSSYIFSASFLIYMHSKKQERYIHSLTYFPSSPSAQHRKNPSLQVPSTFHTTYNNCSLLLKLSSQHDMLVK